MALQLSQTMERTPKFKKIVIERCESSDGESQIVQNSDQNCEEEEAPAENAVGDDSETFDESEIKVNKSHDTDNSETREEINDSEMEHPIDSSETEEEPRICKPWSIFRVPAQLRKLDERAYKPNIVSIGPVHHDKLGLESMEAQKLRFLDRLVLNRIREPNGPNLQLSLEAAMKEMEDETRNCYSHRFDYMKHDDFIRMMVLDGCFIVELLRLYDKRHKGHKVGEPIFATRWMLPNIRRDLLLLENQLPMSVLEKLFELTNFADEVTSLNELVFRFFEPMRPGKDKFPDEKLALDRKYPHLLALFQFSLVPSDYHPSPKRGVWDKYDLVPGKGWVNNARTLRYAGVRFSNKSGGLIEIEYKKNVLRIPTLLIDNGTRPVLRNLLAYEQCNRSAAPYFMCLAAFLGSIVRSPADVDTLRDRSIIGQRPGCEKEVVHLLNSLAKELKLDMDNCPITKLIEDLDHACRSCWAQMRISVGRLLFETSFSRFLGSIISSFILTTLFNIVYQNLFYGDDTSTSQSHSPSPIPSPSY